MYKTRKYFNGAIDTSLLDLASEVFEVLGENPNLKQTISEKLSENHREAIEEEWQRLIENLYGKEKVIQSDDHTLF